MSQGQINMDGLVLAFTPATQNSFGAKVCKHIHHHIGRSEDGRI